MYTYIYIYIYICCTYVYLSSFVYNICYFCIMLTIDSVCYVWGGFRQSSIVCNPVATMMGQLPQGIWDTSLICSESVIESWFCLTCPHQTWFEVGNDTAYLYFTLGLHRFSLSGVWLHVKVETEALISKWPQELRDWFNGQTKHYLHAEHIVPWTVVLMWSHRDT